MNAAAMARQHKERRPSDFCQGSRDCLWRVVTRGESTPCPRHPVPPVVAVTASVADATGAV